MESALARELRENCGYLREEGWMQSARLMELAADEIDHLKTELEHQRDRKRGTLPASPAARRQTLLGSKVRSLVARVLAGR